MPNPIQLETSTAVSNVTPASGWVAEWTENDNGIIRKKVKLSDGTVTTISGSPKIITNVSASSWTSSSTYEDYAYECALTVSGVTANSDVEVIFGATEAASGDYAPVCQSGAGTVTIYGSVNTSITIPKIKVY